MFLIFLGILGLSGIRTCDNKLLVIIKCNGFVNSLLFMPLLYHKTVKKSSLAVTL
jgi:hypothetical protein